MEIRPALDPRAGPEVVLADSPLGVPGASVANVTSTAIAMSGRRLCAVVAAEAVSSWTTAATATSPAPPSAAPAGDLVGDKRHRLFIARADGAAVRQLDRLARDHRDVADPHELARCSSPSISADVDVQVASSGRVLCPPPSALIKMDRLLADDAPRFPPFVASSTRWPMRTRGSHPPTPMKRRKPVSSMGDDEPDLVDVPDDGEHPPGAGAPARGESAPRRRCGRRR